MAKARYHFNIMLRPEPEGGFTAIVPALPSCIYLRANPGRSSKDGPGRDRELHQELKKALKSQFLPTTKPWSPPLTWSIRT